MTATHATTTLATCPNCGTKLQADFKYCPQCSQTTHLHRFSLGHIGHEAFHAVTHADKTALGLARDLAVRPGVVAREYLLEGKRKKYFNPFTFLLLVLGATLIIYTTLRPFSRVPPPNPTKAQLAKLSPTERKAALLVFKQQTKVMGFYEQQAKLSTLSIVPIAAFVFWLCYRRRGLNYAEHVVINILLISIITIWSLLQILLFRAVGIAALHPSFVFVNMLLYIGYYAIGYKQFFITRNPIGWPKAIGVAVLAYVVYMIVSAIVTYGYIGYATYQQM